MRQPSAKSATSVVSALLFSSLFCLGLLAPAQAQPKKVVLSATTHSLTSSLNATAVSSAIGGYIEEVQIEKPSGNQTGDVSLATASGVTLVSKADTTANFLVWPRVNLTTAAGGAYGAGTNIWSRYLGYGEAFTFAVTNAQQTNAVWNCVIKYDDGRP